LNPGRRGRKAAINRFSYGAAYYNLVIASYIVTRLCETACIIHVIVESEHLLRCLKPFLPFRLHVTGHAMKPVPSSHSHSIISRVFHGLCITYIYINISQMAFHVNPWFREVKIRVPQENFSAI
jgi:hypothetical protein